MEIMSWSTLESVPINVPISENETIELDPTPGHPIAIVGPNGSGKSALSLFMQTKLGAGTNRVFAHRRVWLSSSAPELSPASLIQWKDNFAHFDMNPQSRWSEQNEQARLSGIINDVLRQQNYIDGQIGEAVRKGQSLESLQTQGPLQVLNEILEASALNINITVGEDGGLSCTNTSGEKYSAAEMSDGERAALLLAADVLAAPEGTFHLIDEPERHLHRSISASLIISLIGHREQDSFVIFTHDLELAHYLSRTGPAFVLSGCTWQSGRPHTWQMARIDDGGSLPEDVRRAVLGGRRRIAFHEGTLGGLDQQLYEALLRGWAVTPVGSCRNVISTVTGLANASEFHWMEVTGIVDKDFRKKTTPTGIFKLALHEVENIFYCSAAIQFMAAMQAANYGKSPLELIEATYSAMRKALAEEGVRSNIVEQRAVQTLRDDLSNQALSVTKAADEIHLTSTVDRDQMKSDYDVLLNGSGSIDTFLAQFPIRESGTRKAASTALLFPSTSLYEAAVIHRARETPEFAAQLRESAGLGAIQ